MLKQKALIQKQIFQSCHIFHAYKNYSVNGFALFHMKNQCSARIMPHKRKYLTSDDITYQDCLTGGGLLAFYLFLSYSEHH